MYDYPNLRRVRYDFDSRGVAVFVPVCPNCGRFVKADEVFHAEFNLNDDMRYDPNATCKHCGQVEMPFEGWFGREELKA